MLVDQAMKPNVETFEITAARQCPSGRAPMG
jgi:hypothetical protein